jgi:hypothetical protein
MKANKDASLEAEMLAKKKRIEGAAKAFNRSIAPATTSAYIFAVQLLDEWGPLAQVKRVFKKTFPRKQIAFLPSFVGTIGVAYAGTLTRKDKELIIEWAG